MRLSELEPDIALADILDGNVIVQTSETENYAIRCYPQGGMPSAKLADEFLTVQNNGTIRSMTRPIGVFRGYLALTVYCKSKSDDTAKRNRIRRIVAKCEDIVDGATSSGFWFGIDADNVIVPVTIDPNTGYGTTTINVVWHTL